MTEVFKPIPGWPEYEVSNLGRVKSLARPYRRNDKILTFKTNPDGYLCVHLNRSGKRSFKSVSNLVGLTFLGWTAESGLKVDHIKNDQRQNNRVDNLQVVTHRENLSKDIDKTKTSSKYTGVSWVKDRKKWVAQIQINGKQKNIGRYRAEIAAHFAYQFQLRKIAS